MRRCGAASQPKTWETPPRSCSPISPPGSLARSPTSTAASVRRSPGEGQKGSREPERASSTHYSPLTTTTRESSEPDLAPRGRAVGRGGLLRGEAALLLLLELLLDDLHARLFLEARDVGRELFL